MNQLNSLILEGDVVNDIVITEPASGFKVGKFTVSVNRFYKNRKGESVDEVSYFDCECYGVICDYSAEKILKGRGIRVVGRLKQEWWTDNEGKNHSRVYVVCEHIEFKPVKSEAKKEEPVF